MKTNGTYNILRFFQNVSFWVVSVHLNIYNYCHSSLCFSLNRMRNWTSWAENWEGRVNVKAHGLADEIQEGDRETQSHVKRE